MSMNSALIFCGLVAVAFAQTPDPRLQIKASFNLTDTNSDQKLSLAEFYKVYDQFDINGDGAIDLNEYINSTSIPRNLGAPVFNSYDVNKDGNVSRDEVPKIFSGFDENGDGEITLAEFVKRFKVITSALGTAIGK